MTGTESDFERGFKARLVAAANANGARIDGDFAQVRAIVDGAPVVYGVWQDATEADGIGLMIIKGHSLLRSIIADRNTLSVSIAAIP